VGAASVSGDGDKRERTADDGRAQGSSQLAAKSHSELATPQAPTPRDHPPRLWAEDVVCALGAGRSPHGVRNHDPGHRLRSEFSPVRTIEPPRTGQKSDASACSRGESGAFRFSVLKTMPTLLNPT